MDNHKKEVDQEVHKTLNALDGIDKARTDDFFYSRVSARLENRRATQSQLETSLSYGFMFSAAAVFIILILNLISITQYEPAADTSPLDREEVVQQLALEYQMVDLNYYQTYEEE